MKSRRRELTVEDDLEPLLLEMTTKDDPYYSMRDFLQSQMASIREKYDKFQELLKTVDTSNSLEFKECRKGLRQDVRAFDKHLKSLFESVDFVEKNRNKFPHIKDAEVEQRKAFAEKAQKAIDKIKANMDSVQVRKKIEDDERKVKRAAYDDAMTAMNTKITSENEDFVQNQKQVTRQLIKDQDKSLEHLGGAVDRLGEYGREINTEIKTQGKMLDSLGNEIDVASEKMNTVQAALSKLLNTKDTCQIWTVVILAVILIILVALVIWA